MHVEVNQVEGRRFVIRARGAETIVDDTVESGGPGDGFRPTELLLGGLGACMMGTMLTFARNQEIPVHDVAMDLEDEVALHPKRIGRIRMRMSVGVEATERQLASLRRVAAACKIHTTLARGADFDFTFETTP